MSRPDRPDLHGVPDRESSSGDDLRSRFQNLPRERARVEDCPSPDTVWSAVRGELEAGEIRRVILHTGRCPSCAEDWRLARSMARSLAADVLEHDGPDDEANRAHDATGARRPTRHLRAAAGVVVAMLGAGILLWQDSPREPTLRDGPQTTVEQGAPIESLVPEDTPLPRDEATLRWTGPEDAVYTLVVTTEDLEILLQEEGLTESEYTLPDSLVTSLDPGTVLNWYLDAVLPDGSSLESRTFTVTLR